MSAIEIADDMLVSTVVITRKILLSTIEVTFETILEITMIGDDDNIVCRAWEIYSTALIMYKFCKVKLMHLDTKTTHVFLYNHAQTSN